MITGITYLKRIVPNPVRASYSALKSYVDEAYTYWPRIKEIDLRRTFIGGEGDRNPIKWSEMTGDWNRPSTLLEHSVYVQFLEQYRLVGEKVFDSATFAQLPYFASALTCVQFWGDYFGQQNFEGILAQAKSFVDLYERVKSGDPTPVKFPSDKDHTKPLFRPLVQETLTPHTFQVVDGHHRLAIAWVLGDRRARAATLQPPLPTPLQSLVLAASRGRKELDQPIPGPQFDNSWDLMRRCEGQWDTLVSFLGSRNHDLNHSSVVDLACSYGWFVKEFSKRGAYAVGVETDSKALKIGRIAYGLRSENLVQSDFRSFLQRCDQRFDLVLLFGVFHYPFARGLNTARDLFRKTDALTGSVFFFDVGPSHETASHEGEDRFIVSFIKRNTSFTEIAPLGCDAIGPRGSRYGRMLFACSRS